MITGCKFEETDKIICDMDYVSKIFRYFEKKSLFGFLSNLVHEISPDFIGVL